MYISGRSDVQVVSFVIETRARFAVYAHEHHETKEITTSAAPIEGWATITFHDDHGDDDDSRDVAIVAMVREGDCADLEVADNGHGFLGITEPGEAYVAAEWLESAERHLAFQKRLREERQAETSPS